MFCLPVEQTKKFIQALKDGVIDPGKLAEMDSKDRRSFFEKIVGPEDAAEVNAQFESKLLLKNQQAGMIKWAENLTGISEPAKRDIISKIERMEKILNPGDENVFLQDLASKKLGTDVTFEEAQRITELSKSVSEAEKALPSKTLDGSPEALDYGAKRVELLNYVNDLKLSNEKKGVIDYAKDLPGISKGIKASLDNSAIFRQGWKTLFTNPKTWASNAIKSFSDIGRQIKGGVNDNIVMDGIKADIYSRENARNGKYEKMKLDIGTGEEAYPTSIPEKIPLFGRLFKASETAYQGFLMRMRADIADHVLNIAQKSGVDTTNKAELKSIGQLVNSLTGRGDLGRFESAGRVVNNAFFSPKMLKSNFDFLTAHQFQKNVTPFVRKQAITNLIKVGTGVATILGIAHAINPDSVELDPRSADFGKIKIGNTRIDMTAGLSSLITLTSRVIPTRNNGEFGFNAKSSTTGNINKINSGKYGSKTVGGVLWDFAQNKLSPAASVINDVWLRGKTFQGDKPTVANQAKNLFVPLPIANIEESIKTPNALNPFLAGILDGLGISTNSYSPDK